MRTGKRSVLALLLYAPLVLAGCGDRPAEGAAEGAGLRAFVGARIIDGTLNEPIEDGVLIVGDGRVQAIGTRGRVEIPAGAESIDVAGLTVIPGLINTHGHVGDVRGLDSGQYSRDNVLDQLARYARYGVTTVISLGGDGQEGIQVRDEQDTGELTRARLYVAGPVLTPSTVEEVEEQVARLAELGVDWAKIRVDGFLGSSPKMSPEIYGAVIRESHQRGIPVAVHIVEREDAIGVVRAGADFLAHSVRDEPVDDELIGLLRERRICVSPTLTRELSTFVYGTRPDFFDDPFFLREADPGVLRALEDPERMRGIRESPGAQVWEAQLPLAMENLGRLADAGVRIAFGTDSGPPGRFQGYFEHLELEMMVEAGLTPEQVLLAATGDAARCVALDHELGTLEPGRFADFVVLRENPLDEIRNVRTIEAVWIGGNPVPGAAFLSGE